VDGTLLQACASHASLERIDGQEDPPHRHQVLARALALQSPARSGPRGIPQHQAQQQDHRSSVDPDALLARKSNAHPAQPSYRGHVLMDNRHALIVDCRVTQATGHWENGDAAKAMAADIPGGHQKTLGATRTTTPGVCRRDAPHCVTPHVAQNTSRPGGSAIDGRTARHEGYAKSINARRGIEKVFGWIKQWGGLRQLVLTSRSIGRELRWDFYLLASARR